MATTSGSRLDSRSSERIAALRLPLVIGVVYVHAQATHVLMGGGTAGREQLGAAAQFLRVLVSGCLASVAVPLFFFLSGYLFFLGFRFSWSAYRRKLHSRFHTLFLPFLFWNLLVLLLFATAQALPPLQGLFSSANSAVSSYTPFQLLDSIFGITRYPIAYQFWFIRDLMILVMLVPLLWPVLGAAGIPALIVFFTFWLFGLSPFPLPAAVALFFFSLGAFLGMRQKDLFGWDRFRGPLVFYFLALCVLDALTWGLPWNPYFHKFVILLGIPACLAATAVLRHDSAPMRALVWAGGGCSFFLFAIHEPLLTLLRKVTFAAFPPASDAAYIALYLLLPALVIAVSILTYRLLGRCRFLPLALITGGR